MKNWITFLLCLAMLYGCEFIYPTSKLDSEPEIEKYFFNNNFYVERKSKTIMRRISDVSSVVVFKNVDSLRLVGNQLYVLSGGHYFLYDFKIKHVISKEQSPTLIETGIINF